MQLVAPTRKSLIELQSWFADSDSLLQWAGPGMTFAAGPAEFERQLKLNELSSFVLIDNDEVMLGFGQYYERLGHCHLGRLAISPEHRSRGLVRTLILELQNRGHAELGLTKSSLFVLENNHAAIRAYLKVGYSPTPYPQDMPLANCLYMTSNIMINNVVSPARS